MTRSLPLSVRIFMRSVHGRLLHRQLSVTVPSFPSSSIPSSSAIHRSVIIRTCRRSAAACRCRVVRRIIFRSSRTSNLVPSLSAVLPLFGPLSATIAFFARSRRGPAVLRSFGWARRRLQAFLRSGRTAIMRSRRNNRGAFRVRQYARTHSSVTANGTITRCVQRPCRSQ